MRDTVALIALIGHMVTWFNVRLYVGHICDMVLWFNMLTFIHSTIHACISFPFLPISLSYALIWSLCIFPLSSLLESSFFFLFFVRPLMIYSHLGQLKQKGAGLF